MGGISSELNPVFTEYLSDLEHIITFNQVPRLEIIRSRSKIFKACSTRNADKTITWFWILYRSEKTVWDFSFLNFRNKHIYIFPANFDSHDLFLYIYMSFHGFILKQGL